MTIWFDVTSLLADPRRSGIQRVQREILRHWPGRIRPCRFDGVAMRACAPEVVSRLCGPAVEQASLDLPDGPALDRRGLRLFCAELFDDPARAAYYRGLLGIGAPAWLVYDALPWLRPDWYAAGPATRLMPYLRTLRDIPALGFISAATRRDFADRILRRPCPGPVFPLGADGLGMTRQTFRTDRRDIVMLGTIEPRKNAAAAMRAAMRLWAEGASFRLVMIGMVEHDAREERALLEALREAPSFVHLPAAPDDAVRDALGLARAVLFPSRAEGYGLPAVEALACGIPVIAAADLPALEPLPSAGQIRLDPADEPGIAAAIRRVLDDDEAARLWAEAATLTLPGWRDVVADLAAWLTVPLDDEGL